MPLMGLTAHETVDLGLVRLKFTPDDLSSWAFRPLRGVSWNSRTRRWALDLSGVLLKHTTRGRV